MKTAVIQQGVGPFEPILDLVAERHARYCLTHGLDYFPMREKVLVGRYQPLERYTLMQRYLAMGYALVVWLDADCIIEGNESLSQALPPEADFGGVRNLAGDINCGALWVRNTPRGVALMDRLVRELPAAVASAGNPVCEQRCVNTILKWMSKPVLKLCEMDGRWNSYAFAPVPTQPVQIRAYHDLLASVKTKYDRMQRRLRALEAA